MAYTTDFRPVDPRIGTQGITEVSAVQNHALGLIVQCRDFGANANGAGEFQYVKGVTSGARGAFVTITQDDGAVVLLAANAIGPVGILMSALDAATKFGWVQISGKAIGKALADFADNANVYATATAGSVDDAIVAGDRVKLCTGASAVGTPETGMAEFEISRPFMDDGLSA